MSELLTAPANEPDLKLIFSDSENYRINLIYEVNRAKRYQKGRQFMRKIKWMLNYINLTENVCKKCLQTHNCDINSF